MSKERFQSTGKSSFFGDYLYDRIVPQKHSLRQLRQVVDWQRFTYKLVKYYKGRGRGKGEVGWGRRITLVGVGSRIRLERSRIRLERAT